MNLLKSIRSYFISKDRASKTMTANEFFQFKENLKQVIAWTEILAENFDFEAGKYGLVFRKTNPRINGHELYSFVDDHVTWTVDDYSFDHYDLLLKSAIENRMVEKEIDLRSIGQLGRILCFQTCITTRDGAPIAESRNFIDEEDAPPIDTWFFLKRNYLYSTHRCEQCLFCWIPKKFEKVVQQAIDIELLGSYTWFDENDKDSYERLTRE